MTHHHARLIAVAMAAVIVREAGPAHPWSSIVLGIVRSVPFTMRRSEP